MLTDLPKDDYTIPVSPRVGYAYVPMQVMEETYTPEEGLTAGTIFPELDISMEQYAKQYRE